MTTATTILHVHERAPEDVERALAEIFAREERREALHLEGTFSAVLDRLLAPELGAAYEYLICRPNPPARWTPVLELGNRTVGLDAEISHALDGATVFTIFVYGEIVSGYRLTRGGNEVDRYLSDPTYLADVHDDGESPTDTTVSASAQPIDLEAERGHPQRFAELLPPGTTPEDFARVVLLPGWWEDYVSSTGYADVPEPGTQAQTQTGVPYGTAEDEGGDEGEAEEMVDERDRMRCIALALELWGPAEYPLSGDLEDVPNKLIGPGIALAFA